MAPKLLRSRLLLFSFAAGLLAAPLLRAAPFRLPADSELGGFRVVKRDTSSTLYKSKNSDPDSLLLLFEWKRGRPWAATFSQLSGFEEDWIRQQAEAFAPESSPHPLRDPLIPSKTDSMFPGLRQQWSLRDGKGEMGWMGTGLRGNRFFLVFRATAPEPVDPGSGPLTLKSDLATWLETVPDLTSTTCPDPAAWRGFRCFRHKEEPGFLLRVSPREKTALEIFFEEGDPLTDVRAAAEALRDEDRPDYCNDLSQLMHGEALRLLASAARKIPGMFSWPAWKFLEWKEGAIPSTVYLKTWREGNQLPDPLPALDAKSSGLQIKVDLHFSGRSHMIIRENP